MFKILDRVLTRFVPKATVSAGCSTARYCRGCGPIGKERWITQTCCSNGGGCSYVYGACGGC